MQQWLQSVLSQFMTTTTPVATVGVRLVVLGVSEFQNHGLIDLNATQRLAHFGGQSKLVEIGTWRDGADVGPIG